MKKTLRFNYALKPTSAQETKLIDFGAHCRGLWNFLLSENNRQYENEGTFIFYHEMACRIKEIKRLPEFSWVKSLDSIAAQQVAKDLESAIKKSYSKTDAQAYPKFKVSYKVKKLHNDSFRTVNTNNNIRIENGCIKLPKIGLVPIKLHRQLKSAIKSVSVKLQHGKWICSITQEVECDQAKKVLRNIVGYDINSKQSVVGSDGLVIDNPKLLKQSKDRLKPLQKELARRKKGSSRWRKTKAKINTLHGKISRQRKDFAHKIAYTITKSSDVAVFEDLNVKGMQKFNGSMVADNVMGLISDLTKDKLELRGKVHHEIGRFVKSTGICHSCGHHHKLTLKDRVFTCGVCRVENNRDYSAAISIRKTGIVDLIAAGSVARVSKPVSQLKVSSKTSVFTSYVKLGTGSGYKSVA